MQSIKIEVERAERPIFFYDDDPDGLSSFVQFYKAKGAGKGVIVKSSPQLKPIYLRKVQEYNADVVFVLDKPLISEEFINGLDIPLRWIDHHESQKNWINGFKKDIFYYNPRDSLGMNIPVSDIAYRVFKENLWMAMVGAVGDWTLPEFSSDFCNEYPDLLDPSIKEPGKALFESELGHLIKIISFMLKGNTRRINSAIMSLLKVNSPYEILHQSSPPGKFIYKGVESIEKEYNKHLEEAKRAAKDNFLIYLYEGKRFSFTKELSNELLYLFPDKLIIVGRETKGIFKLSIRASNVELPPIVEAALQGLSGSGGGHEHACGAEVKHDDLDLFIERIKNFIKE